MYRFVAYNICNETIQKVSPMNNPLDELFSLYCMKQLKMPPDLQELPQYDALVSGLSRKQRAGLIDLFDDSPLASPFTPRNASRRASASPCRSRSSSIRRSSYIPVYYTKTAPALQHPNGRRALRAGRFSFAAPGALPTFFTNAPGQTQNRKF